MSAPAPDRARRAALRAGAAVAVGVLVAPGLRLIEIAAARPAGEPASAAARWGLLIDTGRCTPGCDACVGACERENGLQSDIDPRQRPRWIRKVELKQIGTGREVSVPVMCQHCAQPPCVDVCPTGASFKRADGIVLVDRHACIGCRYCMMACPYKARSFVHEPLSGQNPQVPRGKGCVEGCTLCVQRIDRDLPPACVEACAAAGGAMLFGDLADQGSEIARRLREVASAEVRADLGLRTAVRYQGL
jgi:molybdopterin-containing oxidoreductase family iron-sulfur binding subunit